MRSAVAQRLSAGWEWFKERAHGPHAKAWLFIVTFTEASFLLVAPEVLLIPILLAGAKRWVYYAALTTIASVLGGIFGYIIGALFFETIGGNIIALYDLGDDVALLGQLFNDYAFWIMFVAAVTPIPYKAFVLAAGFFHVNLFVFIVASIIGRGVRFFAVAYLVRRFGEAVTRLVLRYSTLSTVLFVALVVLWAVLRF